MAQANIRSKIAFDIKIRNVQQLKHVYSNAFVIRGLEWQFKIEKHDAGKEKNRMEDAISVWLYCNIPNKLKGYKCGAQAKIKLVTINDSKKSQQGCISGVYDAENKKKGCSAFKLNELLTNGYIQDDAILFEIELKVGRLERKNYGSLFIEPIDGKLAEKSIKVILSRVDDNFVAAKSVEFNLNSFVWHIVICKWFENKKTYFRLRLYCNKEQSSENDWSCELSTTLKLMPVNADSVQNDIFGSFVYDKSNGKMTMYSIEWSELEKDFVKNGTVRMILALKVKQQ